MKHHYRLRTTILRAAFAALLVPCVSLAEDVAPIEVRLGNVLTKLDPDLAFPTDNGLLFSGIQVEIQDCGKYPYNQKSIEGSRALAEHLHAGLEQGMQCLIGQGPAGKLHQFHESQADRLLSVLESPRSKRFRCVADRIFANAVASNEELPPREDALYALLRETGHPSVIFDTYRIGGLLSTQHQPETYRDFFKLSDEQIREHLTGSPLRLGGSHRYQNLPGLVFHELVHWLGFEHSRIYPDVAHLYETCCFGGSDYIKDQELNAGFSRQACNILKDDDLWGSAHSRYQQMRQWHYKGYDLLKSSMRENYD